MKNHFPPVYIHRRIEWYLLIRQLHEQSVKYHILDKSFALTHRVQKYLALKTNHFLHKFYVLKYCQILKQLLIL